MTESKELLEYTNSILKDYFKFCGFDPDSEEDRQGIFSGDPVPQWQWEAMETSRLCADLVDKYGSPALAFITLKAAISDYGENFTFTLDEVARGEHEFLVSLYKRISSDKRGEEIEAFFSETVSRLAAKPNLLGNADFRKAFRHVPEIVKETERLNFHPLLTSSSPLAEVEIRNKIRVYPSMGECLLDVETRPDGLYLCCVTPEDSCDSFFAFVYKSAGNVLSVDDQVEEAYIGQHKVERQRNARYVERKAYEIFPYGWMFDFSNPDSKGVPTDWKLKGEFTLADLPPEELFPVAVSLLLVLKKYKGKALSGEEKFLSSYLIGGAAESFIETKALVVNKDSALSVHAAAKVELSRDEIFADCEGEGETDNFYSWWKPGVVNYLKRLWCDASILSAFPEKADCSALINNKENVELLASFETLRQNGLFKMRECAAAAIQKKIDDYFASRDFGNAGVREWRKLVLERKDVVLSKLNGADFVRSKDKKGVMLGYFERGKVERYYDRAWYPFNDTELFKVDRSTSYNRVYLFDELGPCRYIWTFLPHDWREACAFVGASEDSLPKELKGWTETCNSVRGNPILSMTDAMEKLQNGYMEWYDCSGGLIRREAKYLELRFAEIHGGDQRNRYDEHAIYNRKCPFAFSVALSAKAFKKMFPGVRLPEPKEELW